MDGRSPHPRMNALMHSTMLHDLHLNQQRVTRRQLFGSAAQGISGIALASLLGERSALAGLPSLPNLPHFAPKAKRVVCLWQGGGPSHVDLFDPKPVLQKMAGQDIPDSVRGTTRLSTMSSGYKKWFFAGFSGRGRA